MCRQREVAADVVKLGGSDLSYQGLGLLTYTAIIAKDYWLLQGLFLFFTLAVIVFNLIADFTYAYLDPRVREA